MKRTTVFLIVVAILVLFSMQAHATLITRGTDTLGNKLIYDTDLNITWYDYTHTITGGLDNPLLGDTRDNQASWAWNLSVTSNGTVFDDWRLPSTATSGLFSYGYDGTTTTGYNITSSEMGHLFYVELGNKAYYDTAGSFPQPGWGLTNTGDFEHLMTFLLYWSDPLDLISSPEAWSFSFYDGMQALTGDGNRFYGIAVRDGDVAPTTPVPEPSTLLLVGAGFAGVGFLRRRHRK